MPFDIHSIVLYYNKDKLKAAGLLGDDGLPKGLDGADNFNAALRSSRPRHQTALSIARRRRLRLAHLLFAAQPAGRRVPQRRQVPRRRQSRTSRPTALAEMPSWVKNGLAPANTDYPASIALFTSGKAALHINGVWEVPTMADLAKKGKLFDWGAIEIPVVLRPPRDLGGLALLRDPEQQGQPGRAPRSASRVLEVIKWFNKHSLDWASAGHIPAYQAGHRQRRVQGACSRTRPMSSLAKTAVFDPRLESRRRRLAGLRRRRQLLRRRRSTARSRRRTPPSRCATTCKAR